MPSWLLNHPLCHIVLQGDKGPHMQDSLRGREGMIQGSPEGPAAFAIAFNVELKLLAEELREAAKGTKWEHDYPVVKAGADDTFVLGPIELILAPIARFKERIKGIGLELKLSKTEWYVRDPEARAKAAPLCAEAGIRLGRHKGEDGQPTDEYGFEVLVHGIAMGGDDYIARYLDLKLEEVARHMESVTKETAGEHTHKPCGPSSTTASHKRHNTGPRMYHPDCQDRFC